VGWRLAHGFKRLALQASLRLAARLAKGTQHQCVVCGAGLQLFLPFGVGLTWRAGALCPGCQSLERHRLAWLFIEQRLPQQPRLLHVAPERCFEGRLRALLGERYVTGDLLRRDVDQQFSVEALPFASASFDAVLCNHVLEHVSDDRRAMAELQRVLMPGGWALLQAPVAHAHSATREDPSVLSRAERRRRFGQHDHVRWYGTDYPERLRQAGFIVEERPVRTSYQADAIARYGLDPHEVLYACTKPAA